MSMFSRKNRPEDADTVRLTSADHAWWTGEAAMSAEARCDGGTDPEIEVEVDVSTHIAAALEEYGYGAAGAGLDEAGVAGAPTSHDGADAEVDDGHGGPGTEERSLFVRDGLPAEDHLGELLGTLGLGADAEWVDIARAHRRLVEPAVGFQLDDGCRRRAANEAYACLRLFHH